VVLGFDGAWEHIDRRLRFGLLVMTTSDLRRSKEEDGKRRGGLQVPFFDNVWVDVWVCWLSGEVSGGAKPKLKLLGHWWGFASRGIRSTSAARS